MKNVGITKLRMDQVSAIYSPRTTLKIIKQTQESLVNNLALNFDQFTINLIKAEFENSNSQLSLINFILLIKQHLKTWQPELPNREMKLIKSLIELFKDMDPENTGFIQWQKFTNFIIQKVTILKGMKNKEVDIKKYTRSNITIKQKFNSLIHKVIYLADHDRLAFFEEGTNKVYLMNPQNGSLNPKPLIVQTKKLTVQTSAIKKEKDGKITIKKKELIIPTETIILDIFYISDPKYKILLTSTNDCKIRGWTFTGSSFTLASQPDNEEDFIQHEFQNQIYCMTWDSLNQIIYCSDKNGKITTWNLKTDIEKSLQDTEGHDMIVMSMITMPKLQFMASGGMDGKVILWDTINNKKKWIYKEHTRGVLSLTFNETLILLFSAGFDHQICIWNPYISNLIHKIQAHSSPILQIRSIQGTNQIVSLDSEGIIKITDSKKFNLLSSFSIAHSDEKYQFEPNGLTVIPKPLKLVICGRSISIFEYDKNYNPAAVDEFMAISCKYLKDNMCLYTPTGNKIKLWNILTGDVEKIFHEVTASGEITAFNVQFNKNKLLVGDSQGHVYIINIKNGIKNKELPKHSGQILYIISVKAMKMEELTITAGSDNEIRILKQNQNKRFQIIRTIHIKKDVNISSMIYHDKIKAILVGTNYGVIGFYEIQTGKLMGTTTTSNAQSYITSINILNQNFIIETTSLGRISLIGTPPHTLRYNRIFSFMHLDAQLPTETVKITNGLYVKQRKHFYVSDDKGYIKCYNFANLLDQLQNLSNQSTSFLNEQKKQFIPKLNIEEINVEFISKAHNQPIKCIQYISEENYLITISYDKKVKIWDAENGKYIDMLQQNYQKKDPKPLAFRKIDTMEIIKTNLRQKIPLIPNAVEPTPLELQLNPKCFLDRINTVKLESVISNSKWKIFPKIDHYYAKQLQQYNKIYNEIKSKQENFILKSKQSKSKKKHDLKQIQAILASNYNDIRGGEFMKLKSLYEPESKQLQQLKLQGQNTIQQSNIKLIDAYGNFRPQIKREIENKAKRNFSQDIKNMILKKSKPMQDIKKRIQQQRIQSQYLYRKQSISKLYYKNDKMIRLSKQQANAAYNLSAALTNINKNDMRALKFVNNIIVKAQSASKLPKI